MSESKVLSLMVCCVTCYSHGAKMVAYPDNVMVTGGQVYRRRRG